MLRGELWRRLQLPQITALCCHTPHTWSSLHQCDRRMLRVQAINALLDFMARRSCNRWDHTAHPGVRLPRLHTPVLRHPRRTCTRSSLHFFDVGQLANDGAWKPLLGICAAVAKLVMALVNGGALSRQDRRDLKKLTRQRLAMSPDLARRLGWEDDGIVKGSFSIFRCEDYEHGKPCLQIEVRTRAIQNVS